MMQDPVDEVAIGREAGVVDVVDMIAGDCVTALISAFSVATRFVIAIVGQKFMADVAVARQMPTNSCMATASLPFDCEVDVSTSAMAIAAAIANPPSIRVAN